MSTRQHRHYSTDFKLQVVKAYLDGVRGSCYRCDRQVDGDAAAAFTACAQQIFDPGPTDPVAGPSPSRGVIVA